MLGTIVSLVMLFVTGGIVLYLDRKQDRELQRVMKLANACLAHDVWCKQNPGVSHAEQMKKYLEMQSEALK